MHTYPDTQNSVAPTALWASMLVFLKRSSDFTLVTEQIATVIIYFMLAVQDFA